MTQITTVNIDSWRPTLDTQTSNHCIDQLENGQALFFPQLPFNLSEDETTLLNPDLVKPDRKNISYDVFQDDVRGHTATAQQTDMLRNLMNRFANQTQTFLHTLFPTYQDHLTIGRTSLRPVEIKGRKAPSYRKDDTRLHVDAFPSTPIQNKRILRVFSNVHPGDAPRQWRLGEPFHDLIKRFASKLTPPLPGSRKFLQTFGITKQYRTLYDHYMLQLHDKMKKDMKYQETAPQEHVSLPAHTTWMVFTDQVSHAVVSGQHILEQTFYLPVEAQQYPERSPLRQLETLIGESLVQVVI